MLETKRGRLVSPAKAGKHVGVSGMTIRRRIESGELTGYRWGNRVNVDLDEVEALMQIKPRTV